MSRRGTDGIAHVARLLDRALGDLLHLPPTTVDLDPASTDGVAVTERAAFAARVVGLQLRRSVDWLLFGHVALARVQSLVPPPLRRSFGVFVHGAELWRHGLPPAHATALARARLRISNSHFTARRLESMYPALGAVTPCPLALLPEGGPSDASETADAALLSRVRARCTLIVGRMSESERYKGHDELIDAWPALKERVAGAQLVVAGGGDDVDRLRAKAERLGVGEDVLFCGRVSDATLTELYRRSTLFAMPSCGEGFGIVYLEAMRAGKPCVACLNDGAADVIVDGRTGRLVPPRDAPALVAALERLLTAPAEARALGAAGRRRYEQLFTYEAFRDRFAAILERAFGASPEGRG